jgi:hypothetical protein
VEKSKRAGEGFFYIIFAFYTEGVVDAVFRPFFSTFAPNSIKNALLK